MADVAALTQLIEPEVKALGFELVRVKMFKSGDELTLQVMAERAATRQLVIEDCATISRRISDLFDEVDPIEEAYRLEVSSPGIDRPLTRLHDFDDWAGHEVRITLEEQVEGRKTVKGILAGVQDGLICVNDAKIGAVRIAQDNVNSAKLVLTDKLIRASVPLSSEGADEIETEE
jgi:ribosome maturation factor RimP